MGQAGRINAVDLFCGAGGTSTGLSLACQEAGLDLTLLAINHWSVAIDTHSTNHPHAKHLCESADNVDPRKVVPGGRLKLLVASPECMHHSNARGGRPMSDQSRASAWHILRWAEALYIDSILIENVKEFRSWGPLGADGRPIRSLRGQLYVQFLNSLRALGYNVEDRVLCAADYGDPTTRERLFIIARKRKPIVWPEATHASTERISTADMYRHMRPWRTAREIIDWTIQGESIFSRKRPLAEKTRERIAAGLRKFGGEGAEPFLVVLRNHGAGRSLDAPLPTVTARGTHIALCEPFVIPQQSKGYARSTKKPLPTVATKGAIALVEPFLVAVNHGRDAKPKGGEGRRARSVNKPMPTLTTKRTVALIEPFLVEFYGERDGQDPRTRSVDRPLPPVTAGGKHHALVEPFLVKYNGTAKAASVNEPVDTVTSKERFALVTTAAGQFYIDIRFRMLTPKELARAQGFPDSYHFTGTKEDVVRQIGNAVPVTCAKDLCACAMGLMDPKKSRSPVTQIRRTA